MFQPKIFNQDIKSIKVIERIRKPRKVIHIFINDKCIQEIIDNKKDNNIKNTYALNKSILKTLEGSENYDIIIEKTKYIREYLIQYQKVRIFYFGGYQLLITFKNKIRYIEFYYLADLIFEGEVDMTNFDL